MKKSRPEKLAKAEIEAAVRSAIAKENYFLTDHARKRMQERSVTLFEVQQVLMTGFCESKKDTFSESFGGWDYAIRGKTLEGRALRVVVAIDEGVVIVTVIALEKSKMH